MHLSFAAAVIHLIDAHPANPNWHQPIRDLESCVDALMDLRTPWCAWADRSLKSVHLLALDWYRCNDILQLKSHHEQRYGQMNCQIVSEASRIPQEDDDDAEDSGLRNTGKISMTASNTESQLDCGARTDVADTLAFLFQDEVTESDMNDIATNWLAEGWYNWLPAVPDI